MTRPKLSELEQKYRGLLDRIAEQPVGLRIHCSEPELLRRELLRVRESARHKEKIDRWDGITFYVCPMEEEEELWGCNLKRMSLIRLEEAQ